MPGPETTFDADECQALLDLIDKIRAENGPELAEKFLDGCTACEVTAYAKLQRAGELYARSSRKK
jgi:hypothetical protein